MSNTQQNLAAAFAGESQANRKYLAFAKQADAEKLPQVAKLFRAALNPLGNVIPPATSFNLACLLLLGEPAFAPDLSFNQSPTSHSNHNLPCPAALAR